jgi:hypothetical protein
LAFPEWRKEASMEFKAHVDQLKRNSEIIVSLSANVTQEQACWRPAKTRWTMLEALNHLVDIEVEDFRCEFEMVLNNPGESWPRFSIERWRIERKYNEKILDDSIRRFTSEREKSTQWLEKLKEPDLDLRHSGKGFRGAPMRAGDILVSWLAHDLFHIRQLSLIRWYILNEWSKPYSPRYSGFRIN